MSARVIHVGDTVHYKWCGGNVSAYTVEHITESDFGVLLGLGTASGQRIVVSADNKNVCLAESINGVTVGADGTVATSTPASEAVDTEADTSTEDSDVFGYVVFFPGKWLDSSWYGANDVWAGSLDRATVFRSKVDVESVLADWSRPRREAARIVPLLQDTSDATYTTTPGYVVLPPAHLACPRWYSVDGLFPWVSKREYATIFSQVEDTKAVLRTWPGARAFPLVPALERAFRPVATEGEPKPEPMRTFGYVVSSGQTAEWITDVGVWSIDPQFARILRGNESDDARAWADFGAALRKRPARRWAPLVEDTGQFKRPVIGYVIQSPGRPAGPDDCAKYWTGLVPWSDKTAWSTNPLMAEIFRDPESARRVRWQFADDARVLRLVEGDGRNPSALVAPLLPEPVSGLGYVVHLLQSLYDDYWFVEGGPPWTTDYAKATVFHSESEAHEAVAKLREGWFGRRWSGSRVIPCNHRGPNPCS